MLVQEYLRNGNSVETLKEEHGIKFCLHETLPLVILNYDQIESTKTNPIVMECRGLILETGTWDIVARSFNRFFNLGEAPETQEDFNWNKFSSFEKVDGSMINVFFYADEWRMATRGSFGEGLMQDCDFSWSDLFWKTFNDQGLKTSEMSITTSFTFELCSRFNKIVTDYPEPRLYLLNWYNKLTSEFMLKWQRDVMAYDGIMPIQYNFKSVDEALAHIEDLELNDPTNEGLVLVDNKNNRIKIKNKKYLSLHKMRGESGFTMKNLLPFIVDGETDELLTYYPEVEPKLDEMALYLKNLLTFLSVVWNGVKDIEDQKEFALALKDFQFPFPDALFTAKRDGTIQDYASICTLISKHNKLYERIFKKFDVMSIDDKPPVKILTIDIETVG